ncbi:MAG TPA: S8 family peptidase, partial [Salinimicrobium catena]|nr:S8 family peptidase [Salinimicrobium catena]
MKLKTTSTLLAMAFAATAFVSCSKDGATEAPNATPESTQAVAQPIPGQYIVVYKESGKLQGDHATNKQAVRNKTQDLFAKNMIADAEILQVYSAALSGVTVKMTKDQVSKLKGSSDIAYIEQDRVLTLAPPCGTPSNPCTDPGSGGGGSGQETPFGITRVNGVSSYTGTGVAWVIDTGIDLDHPDLNVDASRGYNAFTSGRDAKSLDDGNGH